MSGMTYRIRNGRLIRVSATKKRRSREERVATRKRARASRKANR